MSPPRLEVLPGIFRDPDSNVVELASEQSIEAAWNAYVGLVQQQREDERLLTDMPHQQAIARAWAAWRRLYLMTEHAG